jgi:two-component system response regulator (stage 0 sporulation protein F)
MKKLLIVEDSEQFRRLIISMLKGYYDEIYECSDGKQAKAAYEKYKPDCVLMDIHMKEKDGITATRELKTAHPEAHVIIMTQFRDIEFQQAAHDAGANKFIMKDNVHELKKIVVRA